MDDRVAPPSSVVSLCGCPSMPRLLWRCGAVVCLMVLAYWAVPGVVQTPSPTLYNPRPHPLLAGVVHEGQVEGGKESSDATQSPGNPSSDLDEQLKARIRHMALSGGIDQQVLGPASTLSTPMVDTDKPKAPSTVAKSRIGTSDGPPLLVRHTCNATHVFVYSQMSDHPDLRVESFKTDKKVYLQAPYHAGLLSFLV